jgi:hypothetical protein
MLTSAGVSAPDGNELEALQTGLWGAFLRQLQRRQPGGLDHGWVSFFTYEPRLGAAIFADWVAALPQLRWIQGQTPQAVLKVGDRITGVEFQNYRIQAKLVLDGTELGDLLALGEVPHRWGWEWQSQWGEPSAPLAATEITDRYPVQAPTWVVVMQDGGEGAIAPAIPPPPDYDPAAFEGAWDDYGSEQFLNYGRLPENCFMINWPTHGNDYAEGVQRLVGNAQEQQAFLQAAYWHSQGFAHFIQRQLGRRYGLATDTFPVLHSARGDAMVGGGAFALHPYYRESRRLIGLTTLREQDLLPIPRGNVAPLPLHTTASGCETVESICDAIAIGNYANDHHYPTGPIPLQPKSIRWGGRWTGTPFTIPYRSLIPATVDGLLVCEKNLSVSHIANGATRLQPVVLGIGQAAGMAAALCIQHQCQPRDLPVRQLQLALLSDPVAAAAVIPLLNLPPHHPDWSYWQRYYLEHPESYPNDGYAPLRTSELGDHRRIPAAGPRITGTFRRYGEQDYGLETPSQSWQLVTLKPDLDQALMTYRDQSPITVSGPINPSGGWLLVEHIDLVSPVSLA